MRVSAAEPEYTPKVSTGGNDAWLKTGVQQEVMAINARKTLRMMIPPDSFAKLCTVIIEP